jgi:hypothetical protein
MRCGPKPALPCFQGEIDLSKLAASSNGLRLIFDRQLVPVVQTYSLPTMVAIKPRRLEKITHASTSPRTPRRPKPWAASHSASRQLAALVYYFFGLETRGKTFEEIDRELAAAK